MTAPPPEAGKWILLPGQSPDGRHILSVLVKRSYHIQDGGRALRAPEDQPLVPGDEHYGDPMNSTVKHESDFVPFKLATDVVVNAIAYAPGGEPAREVLASVTVGETTKRLLVLGDRVAHHREGRPPLFSDPLPFTEMPVRYERAFGGVDVRSDPKVAAAYARNHLGLGFMVRNVPEVVQGRALPNIEDPDDRLTPDRACCGHFMHMDNLPMPQGFGWVMKYWRPRSLLAGVMPADAALAAELRAEYRKAVPANQLALYDQTELPPMDFRFFSGASPGLVLPYLRGDEVVRLEHLTPEGEMVFGLPAEAPRMSIDIGKGPRQPRALLQTVMMRLEERGLDLVWRAAIDYPGPAWLPQMRRFDLDIAG